MISRSRFSLIFSPLVKQHFQSIERKYHTLIRKVIENELQYEPDRETTNRKPLKPSTDFQAEWEIRFGTDNRFRVFYEIHYPEREVVILAIGIKRGNRLLIGGKEIKL